MKRYLIASILLSIAFWGIHYLLVYLQLDFPTHDRFPAVVLFFFLQSLIIAQIIALGEKTNWEHTGYSLGIITFRLITGLVFALILSVKVETELKVLFGYFVALYLVYLIFELSTVLSNLRRN